ncbi:sulfatase family protein [Arcticibacterium luteifluviistationis]|uniref:Arylsulfatase n=1 Tax=Arcticibacterium luteifluviistationis TaxID=1784714 RepID=A0A2Z4G9Q9_9BACT|nr:arylsulfatase [Arcticibacterium luteifluviistationis]AWV97653.1 arylsulfatase [Arcticibacterium luteifluviistationis]
MKKSILLSLAFGISLLILTGCNDKELSKTKPNVIFILADDMGYGDVSSFNENSKIQTPNIDKLGEQGVKFTDAHTSSAVCTPTRYGVLTGRYNWRSRLKQGVLFGYDKALISQNRKTLPSFLQDNGYKTAGIGKWHLGWDWKNIEAGKDSIDYSQSVENGPSTLGFDYFYGFNGSLDMPPYVWVENDKPTMVPTKSTVNKGKQSWWREGLTSDDFSHELVLPHITDKTISYIEENANKDKPFFVYMPLPAPHTPILPTEEFRGKSGLNDYGDFVIMVDALVGRIMASLEEQGIADNTILIFTADNGCSNQADFDELATKGHDPSYVYRGHKADIFEGGHRVPYVVRWPNKVKPGKSDQLVCTTDLFATLADVLDVPLEDNAAEDSFSFLSLLNVPTNKPKRTSIIHHSINGSFAYRKAEWKTIFCPDSGGWSAPKPGSDGIENLPPFQVYNLTNDAAEEKNLFEQNPEVFAQHKKELADIILNGRSTPGTPQENDAIDFEWKQVDFIKQ